LFNEYDRTRALKRGGGRQIVSFEEHLPEAEAAISCGRRTSSRARGSVCKMTL
jgi:hypothetical protein